MLKSLVQWFSHSFKIDSIFSDKIMIKKWYFPPFYLRKLSQPKNSLQKWMPLKFLLSTLWTQIVDYAVHLNIMLKICTFPIFKWYFSLMAFNIQLLCRYYIYHMIFFFLLIWNFWVFTCLNCHSLFSKLHFWVIINNFCGYYYILLILFTNPLNLNLFNRLSWEYKTPVCKRTKNPTNLK